MLEFLWPTVARHGSAASAQTNLVPTSPPPYSSAHAIPRSSGGHLKRKRPDGKRTAKAIDSPKAEALHASQYQPAGATTVFGSITPVDDKVLSAQVRPTARTPEQAMQDSDSDSASAAIKTMSPGYDLSSFSTDSSFMEQPLHPEILKQPTFFQPAMNSTTLRQTIDAQFSLEILLKHKELRLIDQEIAKCQLSLEQLRRCQVIPYPTETPSLERADDFISGEDQIYTNAAPLAPPWGVTDGPYARHYDRWLLPDPMFDEHLSLESAASSASVGRLPDRQTRATRADKHIPRLQKNAQVGRVNGLVQGHQDFKEEKGPMIAKRASDGQMVKLVCLDCHRSNFNSVQGFINHCRIAHARQFVSHDAAIEASGEEVDHDNDTGIPNADLSAAPSHAPATAGLIHPLIKLARPPPLQDAQAATYDQMNDSMLTSDKSDAPAPLKDPEAKQNVQPSPSTPYLSALMTRIGDYRNLGDLVSDARTRAAIDPSEESDQDDVADDMEVVPPPSHNSRGPGQSTFRPASSGQSDPLAALEPRNETIPGMTPKSSYGGALSQRYMSGSSLDGITDRPGYTYHTPSNLSPNTTDPHPAPSLVSDDGELENTHSESETTSHSDIGEDDRHYLPHINHDGLDLGTESHGFNVAGPTSQLGKVTHPSVRQRPSPASVRRSETRRRSRMPSQTPSAITTQQISGLASFDRPAREAVASANLGPRSPKADSPRGASQVDSRRHVSFGSTGSTGRIRKPSIKAAEAAAVK